MNSVPSTASLSPFGFYFLCAESWLICSVFVHVLLAITHFGNRNCPRCKAEVQGDSFGTRPKKIRISQRLFIRFWTSLYDYIPCFMRSMSILVCRSLTSWRHRDNDWRLAPCRAQPCHCVVQTLNTARYLKIFNEFVDQLDDDELRNGYFQQVGATCHTSNESMTEIESFFDDRIISKSLWPPRSSDLSPPDFFLWGALKGKSYANRPRTI